MTATKLGGIIGAQSAEGVDHGNAAEEPNHGLKSRSLSQSSPLDGVVVQKSTFQGCTVSVNPLSTDSTRGLSRTISARFSAAPATHGRSEGRGELPGRCGSARDAPQAFHPWLLCGRSNHCRTCRTDDAT